MKYIQINKNQIPYVFELNLNNETYQFEVFYNTVGDFFTINLFKNHLPLVHGDKVVYNVPLFEQFSYLGVPKVKILPFDTTKKNTRANYENMGEDVFLYVLD